jgi:PadR family transcriptional regulator PadR
LIKRIKQYNPDSKQEFLFTKEDFRNFVENWESELLRGISTLAVLEIIASSKLQGMYGYQILQELRKKTNNMLILEEGNLYPTLRKLKKGAILETTVQYEGKRKRIYYRLTEPYGHQVKNHLSGAFARLLESMSGLFKIDVKLHKDFFYCPNCTFRYSEEELEQDQRYCSACGFPIGEEIEKIFGGK